jgi:hypothetical protein
MRICQHVHFERSLYLIREDELSEIHFHLSFVSLVVHFFQSQCGDLQLVKYPELMMVNLFVRCCSGPCSDIPLSPAWNPPPFWTGSRGGNQSPAARPAVTFCLPPSGPSGTRNEKGERGDSEWICR